MPTTVILGKKKLASGKGSGENRGSARTQARMAATPPGSSTAAKYENLETPESNYSEEGRYRQPLAAPFYRKEEWSYVDVHANKVWTSTATCYYLKLTHERTNLPTPGRAAPAASRRRPSAGAKPASKAKPTAGNRPRR